MEISNYETIVSLPSKGKFYPDNPVYSEPITIKMLTTSDEKTIYGSSNLDEMINKVIKSSVQSKDFNPNDLVEADRLYLLMQIRILTYGEDYKIEATCPICGKKHQYNISLEDLIVDELDDDFVEPIEVELPISGSTVGIKVLRIFENNLLKKNAKKLSKKITNFNEEEYLYIERLAAQIKEIDGEEVPSNKARDFVKKMYGKDSAIL